MMEMQVDGDGCVMRATECWGEWAMDFLGYVVRWPGGRDLDVPWFAINRYGQVFPIDTNKSLKCRNGLSLESYVVEEGMRLLHDADVALRITYPDPSDRLGIFLDVTLDKRKDCVYEETYYKRHSISYNMKHAL